MKKKRLLLLILAGVFTLTLAPLHSIAAQSGEGLTPIQQLGKYIFFDTTLSKPVGQSCATCHDPGSAFADPEGGAVSQGALQSRVGERNSPSVSYAAFSPQMYFDPKTSPAIPDGQYKGGLFWDGRADTLEEQALQPFVNPLEMHNSDLKQVFLAVRQSDYANLFRQVFGQNSFEDLDYASACIGQAIAAYERSAEVNPFTSKFDYWKKGQATLTDTELRGYMLFTNTTMMGAKCANCHSVSANETVAPSLFTNFGHQNLGVPGNPELPFYFLQKPLNPAGTNYIDRGLGDFLRSIGVPEELAAKEDGRFKIPSLRNCAITAPYEHNGVFTTLREVVMFNNTRDVPGAGWPAPEVAENVHRHPSMDRTFGKLGLTDQQVDDIVAFLGTLTDGYQP
ncbi:cytochrome-c peroxidase [Dehalogenimonas etheniformans]|uniref:Cytochrome-c peroxidase n=1 Tax=Dehalogenimonas etheniformans TaxID=1536648 RepID=A0A2P5P6D4_9CHLR|nr:cytochrome c peroxidase [Dehalogenimonas etheniformans]PPD57868.1 cytochrome-c peroxidase [Dehalogenimonas etheniformans]QNT75479.1 c-type cytochrome [Dehalogenimonas etheniformans]